MLASKNAGAHEGVHLLEQLQKALLLLNQRLALVWCKIDVIAAQQAVCHLGEARLPDSADHLADLGAHTAAAAVSLMGGKKMSSPYLAFGILKSMKAIGLLAPEAVPFARFRCASFKALENCAAAAELKWVALFSG